MKFSDFAVESVKLNSYEKCYFRAIGKVINTKSIKEINFIFSLLHHLRNAVLTK